VAARIDLFPKTGRTHQLRVHMTALGHPLLGDPTYGGRKVKTLEELEVPRVMLHAKTLGFSHPTTGQVMAFTAPLPPDMASTLTALRECACAKT
jgi:23S rRNA pseudouridine1911/1915/1917 synthase